MTVCAAITLRYITQKPLKTVFIEEISSSSPPVARSPVVSKDIVSAVKDTSSTVKKESSVTVQKDVPLSTTESATPTKKQLVSDPLSLAENVTPFTSSSSIQDLPGVPSTSTTFIHDWKRLQTHPELQSNYFQVCDCIFSGQ